MSGKLTGTFQACFGSHSLEENPFVSTAVGANQNQCPHNLSQVLTANWQLPFKL